MILRNLIESRASLESPLRPLTASSLIELFSPGKTASGVRVSERNAYKFIVVYRAVALVSGAISTLPLEAHTEGEVRKPFPFALLADPHPDMTAMELWETTLAHLLLWGNAYLEMAKTSSGKIAYLDPIPPGAVTPKRIPKSAGNPFGKEFVVRTESGRDETYTPYEILHIPGPGYDGLKGLSPIGAAREGIALGLATQEYASKLWASGSLMSGLLTTDKVIDEATAKALKKRWKETMGGLEHAHEVAVLDAGAKFQSLSIPPEDAQFIQSRRFQVEEVGRLYGIPLHMLGEHSKDTSWGTGIEQQQIAFVVFTLLPWITRVEQRVSKVLLPRGVTAHFHTDSLMRGDSKSRYEAHQIAIQNGLRNQNEIRREEGDPPIEGGDSFYMPLNWRRTNEPMTLKDKADAATALVRGGWVAEDAAAVVGLPPMRHTGLVPITG